MLSEPWIAKQQETSHSFEQLASFVIQMSEKARLVVISIESNVHQDHVKEENGRVATLSLIHWIYSNLAARLDVRHYQ